MCHCYKCTDEEWEPGTPLIHRRSNLEIFTIKDNDCGEDICGLCNPEDPETVADTIDSARWPVPFSDDVLGDN